MPGVCYDPSFDPVQTTLGKLRDGIDDKQ